MSYFTGMRKLYYSLLFLLYGAASYSQLQPRVVDSVQQLLAKATTMEEKFRHTAFLSRVMMTMNPLAAEEYGQQLIKLADSSGNRSKMVEAFLVNGERYSYLAGRKDNIVRSVSYYEMALELAKKYKMDSSIVKCYLALSRVNRSLPDYDKALDYCDQARAYSDRLKDDSICAEVYLEYGSVHIGKNEKIKALRNFLDAIRIGEEVKNIYLQRDGFNKLSGFYATIGNYDTAIYVQLQSLKLLEKITGPQAVYRKIDELNRVGNLHSSAKNYDNALYYYERALRIADSIKYEPIKPMTYMSIINNYLRADQPQKALDYFNTHPQLKDFLRKVNFGNFIEQSYGFIYLKLGKYDSAKYYYSKVGFFFENDANSSNKYGYYLQMGMLHSKTGEVDKSIDFYLKAKAIADDVGDLDQMSEVVIRLDSLYQKKGDFKQAYAYASLNVKYKDSSDKLGREKELLQIEVEDTKKRVLREQKEQEEIRRRRNNIQYIGITFGIALLFVTLVVLGMFKVSTGLIRAIGFFVFLMLFEFIFLLFKKNIYSITHGEPLKDLAFMIGLAALLVPLHHWLEHKVLHFLTSHNRLTAAGHHIKRKLFRRTKVGEE
jgi:tetratricopeptide (TPR) repeat protein